MLSYCHEVSIAIVYTPSYLAYMSCVERIRVVHDLGVYRRYSYAQYNVYIHTHILSEYLFVYALECRQLGSCDSVHLYLKWNLLNCDADLHCRIDEKFEISMIDTKWINRGACYR